MKRKQRSQSTASADVIEKRIFKRRQLIYYLELLDDSDGHCVGHIVDISLEGMLVMSEKPFAMHQPYRFKIAYKKPSTPRQVLQINARSKWSQRGIHTNYFDTGFELVGLEPAAVETLEYIIETMCF